MDQHRASVYTARKGKRTDKSHRSWTNREEETLIAALKDIVAKGWKADYGFKIGYLQVLEQSMIKAFPSTDLRAIPHINSKIHVWKKNYGSLYSMLSRSGVGWNNNTNMIEAEDDGWDNYVKFDSNARLMRYKSWTFYNDSLQIFGKDRATGENANDFVEAVNELLTSQHQKESNCEMHSTSNCDGFEDETEGMSVSQPITQPVSHQACSSASAKKQGKNKRKCFEGDDISKQEMMAYWDRTEARLGEIAQRIGYEYDISKVRKEVFAAVSSIEGFNLQEKLLVSNFLVKNKEALDLFFSLPDEAKTEYVHMMLAGSSLNVISYIYFVMFQVCSIKR